MKASHWLLLLIVLLAGYVAGARYPQLAHKLHVA